MPKQVDPCMFCGGLPCRCDGGTKKKSSRSTAKASSPAKSTKESPGSTPSVSATAESKEDVFGAIPTVKSKFKSAPTSASERDLSFLCALRNIRDIVSPRDQRWIDVQLRQPVPKELDRRIAKWKERNGQA